MLSTKWTWSAIIYYHDSFDKVNQPKMPKILNDVIFKNFSKIVLKKIFNKIFQIWRNPTIFFCASLKVPYSPYVNKAFDYIFVSKMLSFIRQLFIFSNF